MNQAPKGSNSDDICHLTAAGSAEYASIIYTTFRAIIDQNQLCQTGKKALPAEVVQTAANHE